MKDISLLCVTAASIGFIHTALGPDHYIPFIVMGKARDWSRKRLAMITVLCGIGHVGSSVVLGLLGIALGAAVTSLTSLEAARGEIAAWGLIVFGFVYFCWGLKKAWRNEKHTHLHFHSDGSAHEHEHVHESEHLHVHEESAGGHGRENEGAHGNGASGKVDITPWILFTVFVLGPCEPLIPLLMYPAATSSPWHVFIVAGIFSAVTIVTMTTIVLLVSFGISLVSLSRLERFTHALAGATICASGLAVQFLGL